MRRLRPIFIQNSRVPVWLSKVAPITIGAITLGFIVFSRGKMDERTKNHERIHFQQFLETLFIGFILLYIWDYFWCYMRYSDGKVAYRYIRAEQEAYDHDHDQQYVYTRKRWSWLFKKVFI